MDNPLSADIVDLVTVVAVVAVAIFLRRFYRWFVRIPLAALLGWPIFIAGVASHWQLLMLSASTDADRAWVATHDSGPLGISLLFGWLFALVVVVVVELVMSFMGIAKRLLRIRSAA